MRIKIINLTLLFIIMMTPILVNAKEYCEIVSGTGSEIGNEIACGSEHFYITDIKDNNITMLFL